MQEQDGKKFNISERLEDLRREREALRWEGSFRDYFELVSQNPRIAQLSHARINDMVHAAGVEKLNEGTRDEVARYNFFASELFGIEEPIARIVEYFKSAAQRLEVRKRILLLMGPVGGGKSTIVTMLKRGLEEWTSTEQGAVFAIKDCPMHEEPLHLIPHELRAEIEKHYGIYIEGDLCPQCRYALEHEYGGRHEDVKIHRVIFSEKERVGIGTFSPSDPKCVTGDTILLTNRGMLRFDELQREIGARRDEFVPFSVGVSGIKGTEWTSHFYNGGVHRTRRIRTRLGYEIEGSMVHPVLVLKEGRTEWIELSELKVGDHVALQRGQNLFGDETRLLPFGYDGPSSRGQNKFLTLPREMTPDLARLLGYIVAEGSLTDTALWLTNGDQRVVDDMLNTCERLFAVRPKIYTKQGTHALSLSISSVKLVRWLEQVCGITRGAAHKRMPRVVSIAPRHILLSFLEGWFWGDGTISARKNLGSNRFKVATASKELARQAQIALLNLGIVSALYQETIKERFTAYSVVVTGDAVVDLLELIPSLRDKCTDAPEHLAAKRGRTNFDIIPEMQIAVRSVLHEVAAASGKALPGFHRYATNAPWGRGLTQAKLRSLIEASELELPPDSPALAPLRERLDDNLLWLEVQEITEGQAQVYDLTVPATHSFCANGFINHNSQDITELTGSIDLSTIGEVGVESDPRAYRFDGELNIANRGLMEFIEMLKCLSPTTYVPTEYGLLQIGELAPPHSEHHQDFPFEISLQTRDGVRRASHVIYNGKGKTVRVRTRKGYVVEGAADHRILVLASDGEFTWRQLKSIKSADRVCINRQGYFGVTEAPLIESYVEKNAGWVKAKFPSRMTVDLAQLLGYFVAEGWYLKGEGGEDYGIGIANEDEEVVAELQRIAVSLGLKLTAGGRCRHHIWSRSLALLFHNFGLNGRRAEGKHIPQIIRRSPKEIISAFLRAYFDGDGTASSYISCTTASEKLAEQLQVILLNYGIISKRQVVFSEKYQRSYYQVQVDSENVEIFNREIAFGLSRKRESAERLGRKQHTGHRDGLPNLEKQWLSVQRDLQLAAGTAAAASATPYRERVGVRQMIGNTSYEQLWRFARGMSAPSYTSAHAIAHAASSFVTVPDVLQEALDRRFFYDEIAEVSNGFDDLWDFCVPEGHTYVGNGFVNHNCDEKFLYSLLTLSQEQNIKTGRFAMIYADEVILSHTNENEYISFAGNRKSEALQDRIILVRVPYNLRVSQEERIYYKLLNQSEVLRNVHIAPNTLKVAAMFAVMTRLEEPKRQNVDITKKMKLYDGEDVEGYKSKDVRELKDETIREGMDGISPRYIINRLSSALVRDGVTCINPIDALRTIKSGFEQHTGINPEQRDRYLNLISAARKEYDELAKIEVQRAFVYSFEEMARTICNNYLDNVESYCNKERIKDPITEEEMDPDEQLMRSIEEQIGISENAKNTFRQEILIRISSYARKGRSFEYTSHERLKEAIEKKIFADLKDVVKITTSAKTPDPDQLRRINEVVDRLVKDGGYCPVCANELLTYVGTLLSR
ncbi:MAG: serine protein kinase [Acidobacteriota bacterium]|jgi:predicted Ser/Thr protein kinase/intein/homing endonuclease|nr:serine protein kinase [Acidobacteriota bacterium]